MNLNEQELVQRARLGDEAAFEALFELHAPSLNRLACAMAGNASDGEDALQEAFLGAFERLDSFESRSSFKTWLSRILMNQVARQRRSKRVREVVRSVDFSAESQALLKGAGSQGLGDALGHADDTGNSAIRMDVSAALERLSDEFRQVVVLREIEGLSYSEIADVLNVPQGTVESRLFRARAELRRWLKDYL